MNLIWRFLWVLLFSKFSKPAKIFDETCMNFIVLPTDIDILMHMNNGRYLSLMDLGRVNFLIRNQLFSKLSKNNIYGVVASEMIRFKQSLNLFQHFQLYTRILGWDDKFFYVTQHFTHKNQIHAVGVVKIRFLQKKIGPISPNHITTILGLTDESPPLPAWLNDWLQADQAILSEAQPENVS